MARQTIFDDDEGISALGGYSAPAQYTPEQEAPGGKPNLLPDPGSSDAFRFNPQGPEYRARPEQPDEAPKKKSPKSPYDPDQPVFKKPFKDFWDWREDTPNGSYDQYKREYPDQQYEKELDAAPEFSWRQFKKIFPDATPEMFREFNDRMNSIPRVSQDDLRRGYDLFMREPHNKGTTFEQYKEKFWNQYPTWEDLTDEELEKEMTETEKNEVKRRSVGPGGEPIDQNDAMNRAWYWKGAQYRALRKRPELFFPKEKPTIKIPPTAEQEKKEREDAEKRWEGFQGF